MNKPDFTKIKHPIAKRLHELASKSKAKVGKISALLFHHEKLVEESKNSKIESHAEAIIIRQAKKDRIPLEECDLYVLITPCIMCSEIIVRNKIKKVFYLHPYGNDDGLQFLKKNGVTVRKIK